MKKIILFLLVIAATLCCKSQTFPNVDSVNKFIDDSIVRYRAMTATTMNKTFHAVTKFLPQIIQDTSSLTIKADGQFYFQRKDSTTYVFDTIGYKRFRKVLQSVSATPNLQSVTAAGNSTSYGITASNYSTSNGRVAITEGGASSSGLVSVISNTGTTRVQLDGGQGTVRLGQVAAPSSPSAGYGYLYTKTDKKVYWKNEDGSEYDLTATGSTSLSDVGGGLPIQTGGLGDIRTLNTGEFDVTTNLISLKTSGIANSKLTNSTISGKSLGSNLDDLTFGSGLYLNSGSNYNGSTAKTAKVDSFLFETRDRTKWIVDSLKLLGLLGESRYTVFDEFSSQNNTNGFAKSISGTGSSLTYNSVHSGGQIKSFAFGDITFNTGTTSSGLGSFGISNGGTSPQAFWNGINRKLNTGFRVAFDTMANTTNNWAIFIGFYYDGAYPPTNINDPSQGAYFYYHKDSSGGNWVARCKDASASSPFYTDVNTGISVTAYTTYALEITLSDSVAYFWINSTLVASISTHLQLNEMTSWANPNCYFFKLSGTTPRKMFVDWGGYGQKNN